MAKNYILSILHPKTSKKYILTAYFSLNCPKYASEVHFFGKIMQKVNFLALFWQIIEIFIFNRNVFHEPKLYSVQTKQNLTLNCS